MMFRHMIRGETGLLDRLDQPQPLVEKAAQRRTVGVEMIEDGEFQHASFSGDEGMNWR